MKLKSCCLASNILLFICLLSQAALVRSPVGVDSPIVWLKTIARAIINGTNVSKWAIQNSSRNNAFQPTIPTNQQLQRIGNFRLFYTMQNSVTILNFYDIERVLSVLIV